MRAAMRRLLYIGILYWACAGPLFAEHQRVLIEVLMRQECPHCEDERAFLEDLAARRDDVELRFHDVATPQGGGLFLAVVRAAGLPYSVPVTIVGTDLVLGFGTAEVHGREIERLVERNLGKPGQGFDALLQRLHHSPGEVAGEDGYRAWLPLVGTVDLAGWPLPVLAITLGFLDGFNPCAMWVLVMFLAVLAQIGSRQRMWQLAGLFILAQGLMYWAILSLWYRVWNFVGMDRVVTPLVGLVALGGGLFFLYEWYKSLGTELACRVSDLEQRSRIIARIRALATQRLTWLTAVGVIGLAFSVNVIEFACSVGYPQAFTKIIELNGVGFWPAQFYLMLYTLLYMLDDVLVFGTALWGFGRIGLATRYTRATLLGGGVVMVVLGTVLLYRPSWLYFG